MVILTQNALRIWALPEYKLEITGPHYILQKISKLKTTLQQIEVIHVHSCKVWPPTDIKL